MPDPIIISKLIPASIAYLRFHQSNREFYTFHSVALSYPISIFQQDLFDHLRRSLSPDNLVTALKYNKIRLSLSQSGISKKMYNIGNRLLKTNHLLKSGWKPNRLQPNELLDNLDPQLSRIQKRIWEDIVR